MDKTHKKKIVVADICNTLYDSNTTFDFIKYCIATKKVAAPSRALQRAVFSRSSPLFWFIAVIQKITGKDILKFLVVRFLKGRSIKEVEIWADNFFEDYLKERSIAPAFSVLKQCGSSNIILVSSTLQPIAASIAKNLNVAHFLSTELEIINGYYTGYISKELSGRKLQALKESYGSCDIELVITDNFTDKELMNRSNKKFAVCYNARQEKFWSQLPQVTILKISTPIDRA